MIMMNNINCGLFLLGVLIDIDLFMGKIWEGVPELDGVLMCPPGGYTLYMGLK